jgi:peptidoglycan hydrolase-like protein with peptidoglycan-binding domain
MVYRTHDVGELMVKFIARILLPLSVAIAAIVGPVAGIAAANGISQGCMSQILRVGSSGGCVTELQQALTDKGYSPGSIDGKFGPKTKKAVEDFQRSINLKVDGIAGPNTLQSLDPGAPTCVDGC